jgi:prephenate dehydrogenase
MWSELFALNRESVLAALAELEAELETLRSYLASGDEAAVRALLERARSWRSGLTS